MNKPDYEAMFSGTLNKVKQTGQGQYIAQCPFHEDNNPSFTYETIEAGFYKCYGCDAKGNGVQYAKAMELPNPHQYINNTNGTNGTRTTSIRQSTKRSSTSGKNTCRSKCI